jgi:hypothetical protein
MVLGLEAWRFWSWDGIDREWTPSTLGCLLSDICTAFMDRRSVGCMRCAAVVIPQCTGLRSDAKNEIPSLMQDGKDINKVLRSRQTLFSLGASQHSITKSHTHSPTVPCPESILNYTKHLIYTPPGYQYHTAPPAMHPSRRQKKSMRKRSINQPSPSVLI